MKTIGPGRVKEPRVHWPGGIFGKEGKVGLGERLWQHPLEKTILRTIALVKNWSRHSLKKY